MELKEKLDHLREQYNKPEFITNDPIQFAHQYTNKKDIEIVSFLVATISWGKRPMILKSAKHMLNFMGKSPYDYVMSKGYEYLGKANIHRTFFESDLKYYCKGFHSLYTNYIDIEDVFNKDSSLWNGIVRFREIVKMANGGLDTKHISNPLKKSACKRLFMALRWLVRDDGIVDLGLWKSINPSQLYIPLDTHVARVSRELGLLERKSNDRQAVEELTIRLRELDANDPISYDFALFGWGEAR